MYKYIYHIFKNCISLCQYIYKNIAIKYKIPKEFFIYNYM